MARPPNPQDQEPLLVSEIEACEHRRNAEEATSEWLFTVERARKKLGRANPAIAGEIHLGQVLVSGSSWRILKVGDAVADIRDGDAVVLLRSLPATSVDLIISDPPYESLEIHRAKGTTTRLKKSKASSNAWFPIFHNSRFPELMQETWRVLKEDRHAYFFCDETTLFPLVEAARSVGFRFWKSLIWVKTKRIVDATTEMSGDELGYRTVNIGMGYHWRNSTERVAFFEKGKRKLRNLGWPDILFGPRGLSKDYPTEKPPDAIRRLVLNSSTEGELVLDPFCGSGVVGEVALQEGRRAMLFDLDASQARKRLRSGRPDQAQRRSRR